MGVPLNVLTDELAVKVSMLATKYTALLARCKTLEEQNEALALDIKELRDSLDRQVMDNKFLTLSHRLAQSPEALVESRKLVANLIRDIDKCIAQLKE